MRYTHLGIGHSATLRRITRDCLGSRAALAAQTSKSGIEIATNEEDADDEEMGDGEGCDECDDGQEDSVVKSSDSEEFDEPGDGELDDDDDDDDDDDGDIISF
jgi:hypothetical protein